MIRRSAYAVLACCAAFMLTATGIPPPSRCRDAPTSRPSPPAVASASIRRRRSGSSTATAATARRSARRCGISSDETIAVPLPGHPVAGFAPGVRADRRCPRAGPRRSRTDAPLDYPPLVWVAAPEVADHAQLTPDATALAFRRRHDDAVPADAEDPAQPLVFRRIVGDASSAQRAVKVRGTLADGRHRRAHDLARGLPRSTRRRRRTRSTPRLPRTEALRALMREEPRRRRAEPVRRAARCGSATRAHARSRPAAR